MGLNPEVLPVWGTNTTYVRTKLVPSENSLLVLPSHKKQSSHSNKAECFLFSLLQGYPKRQREFNVLKCLSFPLPAFAFFQNFWETSAVIWQSLFFSQTLMVFPELCRKASASDSILSILSVLLAKPSRCSSFLTPSSIFHQASWRQ